VTRNFPLQEIQLQRYGNFLKCKQFWKKINRFFLLFGGGSTSAGLFMQAKACKHNRTEAGASAQRWNKTQFGTLPLAAFRFHFAMDTLALS
jgi:hypothetical protein